MPEALRAFGETNVRLLIYGVMVLFVLWFLPGGIGRLLDRLLAKRRLPVRPLKTSELPLEGKAAPGRVS